MSRYDNRYDSFARRPNPMAGAWYPGAFWGGAPVFGWGGWDVGWPPYLPYMAYGDPYQVYPPRRPPEASPAYGRGGDRAVREWAARRGYDASYPIQPRFERDRPYDRPFRGYDRGFGRGYDSRYR